MYLPTWSVQSSEVEDAGEGHSIAHSVEVCGVRHQVGDDSRVQQGAGVVECVVTTHACRDGRVVDLVVSLQSTQV